jgi:hypothetical protein
MPETKSPLLAIFLLATALAATGAALLRFSLLPEITRLREGHAELRAEVARLADGVQTMRFEKPAGNTLGTILEHIKYWSGKMEQFGNSVVEKPRIEAHIKEGMQALAGLGPTASGAIEEAFLANATSDDELRWRLLKVLCQLDRPRGQKLAERCLRREISVSPRLRLLAADELLALDGAVAGELLKNILTTEYHRSARPPLPGEPMQPQVDPGFYNYVIRFLQSSYAGKENVLLQLLFASQQDLMTLTEVIGGLATQKSMDAVPRIQELFEVRNQHPYSSPLFRRRCAQALVEIRGEGACAYLNEQVQRERDEVVKRVLETLIKDNCR